MMMNVQQSGAITDADLLHQRDASAPDIASLVTL
jgi:hypothetical protein